MKRILCLAPAFAAVLLAQDRSAITREGKYWVDTVTATVQTAEVLRIAATGAVTVEGQDRTGTATYSLRRRAKASSEQEARRLLAQISVEVSTRAGRTVIEVRGIEAHLSVDLRVQVPRRLRETAIETEGGSVRGLDLDGALRADTGGGMVEVDRVQGAVVVRTGGGAVRVGKIGGRLECYSGGGAITAESLGSDANINTGGGAISVREAKGLVHARTGGGSIRVERAGAGVKVAAGGGLLEVLEAGGPVVAETGSGSIKVRSASDVRCASGAGMIHMVSVSGKLEANTGSGSIIADLSGASRLRDSTLDTSNGDITVLIPSNLAVTVQASNETAGTNRIVSDFPEIRPRHDEDNNGWEARGSLNGGGPVLRLTSSGGTIYVRRQK